MISVVIPTWNGLALLGACLESLRVQTWKDVEIIVSDDGSTDGTAERLARDYPEVILARSERNEGFVAAANRGIRRASGAWIFLLNNDVTLAPDCLERLMAATESTDATMLTPLVFWTEEPHLVYSAGDRVGPGGRPESIGYLRELGAFAMPRHPFGVSGGYGLFHRRLFDEVGLLEPAYGAYFEDADLCFRARWAGHRALLVPEAIAWHVGSASIADRLWWRTRRCHRNHALIVIRNFSIRLLWWNAGAILRERGHQYARLFNLARNRGGLLAALAAISSAWTDVAWRVPGALRARRKLLRGRKITDEAMQRLLTEGGDHD